MKNIYNVIYAVNKNNLFAVDGNLPWKCDQDMEHFRKTTLNGIVIMGRNTFNSLPFKKGLPKRVNIVITSLHIDDIINFDNLQSAITYIEDNYQNYNVFFIGGVRLIKNVIESRSDILSFVYKSIIKDHCVHKLADDNCEKLYLEIENNKPCVIDVKDDFDLYKYEF